MTTIKNCIAVIGMTFLSFLACAQNAAPQRPSPPEANAAPQRPSPPEANVTPRRISPSDAKNHVGDMAIVCGNVVDTKVTKYGLAGRGKPVVFDLDQPEPNPVFYFVTFGDKSAGGPQEAISAYKGKSVCVTGKISVQASVPFIMASDRSKIQVQAGGTNK